MFFGEQLPQRFLLHVTDFPMADLLIILGTSLEVCLWTQGVFGTPSEELEEWARGAGIMKGGSGPLGVPLTSYQNVSGSVSEEPPSGPRECGPEAGG